MVAASCPPPTASRTRGGSAVGTGDISRRRESRLSPYIAEESRTVEVWCGTLCGDVPTTVAVNVTPLADRDLRHVMDRAAAGLRAASVEPRPVRVPGATRSERLDGFTRGDSPA